MTYFLQIMTERLVLIMIVLIKRQLAATIMTLDFELLG